MYRPHRRYLVLLVIAGFEWSCGTEMSSPPVAGTHSASGQYEISDRVKPSQETVPGLNGGPGRTVGAAVGPDGKTEQYIQDEVVLQPGDQADLDEFVTKYNGEVLDDGTPAKVPESARRQAQEQSSGYYLVRVDLNRSTLDDLGENLSAAGVEGQFVFSSEEAARLAALVLREQPRKVTPNLIVADTAVLEHPDGMGSHVDASRWAWMTEDDDPNAPGDQGLSVGVVHAWDYLNYHDVPPPVSSPPHIAVVDRGFALDTQTGKPLNGNLDYFAFGDGVPFQWDIVGNDNRAGGESSVGGWHGTEAFGVCCALPRNLYGSAGVGGRFVRPMLIKTGSTLFSLADGIRYSAIWGADVITVSLGVEAGILSELSGAEDNIQNAVYTAVALGATVLAGAGNGDNQNNISYDISSQDFIPCKLDGVICVGSVDSNGNNLHNYGSGVDIWAPTGIFSTVTPETAGNFGIDALSVMYGTSASTPFVAGVVGLMKTVQPELYWDEVESILKSTSNPSSDPKVSTGYVDAFRAVEALLPTNQGPVVTILEPTDGSSESYGSVRLKAQVTDPEPGARIEDLVVVFTSETFPTEPPCVASITYEDNQPFFTCNKRFLFGNNDTHVIRATGLDPHGGVGFDTVSVEIVNKAPSVQLINPSAGKTFFEHQPIDFGAYISDAEQLPFPEQSVSWESDVDGNLGTGWSISTTLSKGTHTVTVTAVDERGAAGQDSIFVNVASGAGIPSATILSPADGTQVFPGTVVTFEATGTDPEDGDLPPDSFVWTSDIDGLLGSGPSIQVPLSGPTTPCNPEFVVHTITLFVTDSDGNVITYEFQVSVGAIC